MDDFDFSDINWSDSGSSDILPSEFTVDSGSTDYDYTQFQGADSLASTFGGVTDVAGKVFGSLWDGAKAVGTAYSGMDSSTKGLLASIVAGGGQAYLQGKQQEQLIDAKRAMDKESWDRVQEARRIPEGIKLGTAGGFK
ncbi:hypothetical protein [Janthinobacterium sp. B9-8]|uniref:hypothetical protein n=1 Tax=Janthinobacterium sp. B9-8 TaxID=1236179 RepID=UPI00061D0765|nr:hypothetical protein [Janthinobacterium sp. B9-8]AMC34726.1 hypothetical protein VN23_08950 [Janthinobacterium sp. B9-8]